MTCPAPQDLAENDQLDPCAGRDGTSSRRPVLMAWTGTLITGMDPEPAGVAPTPASAPAHGGRPGFVRRCLHDQPVAVLRERRFGFTAASTAGAWTFNAAAEVLCRLS